MTYKWFLPLLTACLVAGCTLQPVVMPADQPSPLVAPPAAAPARTGDLIVDDASPSFAYSGAWFASQHAQAYRGACRYAPPGAGNTVRISPALPVTGTVAIYAWACGDANHDRVDLTSVAIMPSAVDHVKPITVEADLKQQPGEWVALGSYLLGPGASLSIASVPYGSVAVDAFRFVYTGGPPAAPTPLATPVIWTNHPPSPQEQLTSGDLAARLGLVQRFYTYTPAVIGPAAEVDDCTAFPRPGCVGLRTAQPVTVTYQGPQPFTVNYQVAQDLSAVALDAPAALRDRQLLFLTAQANGVRFYVYRYPDQSWHWVSSAADGTVAGGALSNVQRQQLTALADAYGSIGTGRNQVTTPTGRQVQLYGFGKLTGLTPEDAEALAELADGLGK